MRDDGRVKDQGVVDLSEEWKVVDLQVEWRRRRRKGREREQMELRVRMKSIEMSDVCPWLSAL